ncbi:MAG: hypothetical protein HY297_01510, partial [Thaumarchaeota archaeon]|nr:hypothetical protein [Nitrososphaerota archaeon]
PKRLRYPLFLLGLVVILLGGLAENSAGSSTTTLALTMAAGFALLLGSVAFR